MSENSSEPIDDASQESQVDVVDDGVSALVVASFATLDEAREAYEELRAVADGDTLRVDGVVILTHDEDGSLKVVKATDHSTRSGVAWGALGGVLVGVFFPPSILAGALVGGAAGAVIGEVRKVHHKNELADELEGAIEPGHSGILALVSDPGAVEIRNALAKANAIVESSVDNVVARDIKAAAKEAEQAQS